MAQRARKHTHVGIKRQSWGKKTDTLSFHGDHSCQFATARCWFDNWARGVLIAWDVRSLAGSRVTPARPTSKCIVFSLQFMIICSKRLHCTFPLVDTVYCCSFQHLTTSFISIYLQLRLPNFANFAKKTAIHIFVAKNTHINLTWISKRCFLDSDLPTRFHFLFNRVVETISYCSAHSERRKGVNGIAMTEKQPCTCVGTVHVWLGH